MSEAPGHKDPSCRTLLENENRVMRKLLRHATQQLDTMGTQLRSLEWSRDGYGAIDEMTHSATEQTPTRKAEQDLFTDPKLENLALHKALAAAQFRIHTIGGHLRFGYSDGKGLANGHRRAKPWRRLWHAMMLLAYEVVNLVGPQANLMRQANAARDSRDFARAANLYAQACAVMPGHFRLWVQQGNMAKDSGLFAQAQKAYEHACSIYAYDGDVHLQMGHMFKLMGDLASAAQAYATSLSCAPEQPHAMRELEALGYGEVGSSIRADARR